MALGADLLHRLLQRHVDPHGDDVGARHHDVVGGGLAQAQHVGDQRAFLAVEFGLLAGAPAASAASCTSSAIDSRSECSGWRRPSSWRSRRAAVARAVAVGLMRASTGWARAAGAGCGPPPFPSGAHHRDGGGRGRRGAARRAPPGAPDDARAAAGGCGLAADHAERQHHLRRRLGVGQHVGRLVAAAMARVQAAHRRSAASTTVALARAGRAGRAGGDRLGARDQPAPGRLRHDDADLVRGSPPARGRYCRGPSLLAGSLARLVVSRARRASRRLSPSAAAR